MIDQPEPDSWLHPDVDVRDSPIEGKGLFARVPIPAGTAVSRLGGRLVTGAELQAMFDEAARDPDHPYIDSITVDDDLHLVQPPRHPSAYGNHSCHPNLWWTGAYTLAARLDIEAGEELTSDYATCSGVATFRMVCACGSSQCRGVVTGADWQRPDLQAAYGIHWTPGLRRLIGAQWTAGISGRIDWTGRTASADPTVQICPRGSAAQATRRCHHHKSRSDASRRSPQGRFAATPR